MKYAYLVSSIESTHNHFQQYSVKAVNISLTIRNWLIGLYIIEFEQGGEDRAAYGSGLLDTLAKELKIKGLVAAELSRCRQFYNSYPQILGSLPQEFRQLLPSAILGSLPQDLTNQSVPSKKLIAKLSYTHFIELIKIEDPLKRTFYEIECIKGTWSVRELKRQINSLYFERCGISARPELLSEETQRNSEIERSTDLVKSVYAFEFLGLNAKDIIEESDLEGILLDHLQLFMLEMGHGFCLEARQKKILIGDEYFFVDLVFYHRILKCHILVELKVEDFNHHNIGQLNTYVNYYKAEIMQDDDNPPIGILLVTNKNNALVEYATAGMDNQLFVSKYLLELPKKEQLKAFIEKELKAWE
jgi:predicted nuclease of restriction endonuclease-like (RecB) superfamily